MHIAQVIARIDDPSAGPSYSVTRLCEVLAANAHRVQLLAVEHANLPARGDLEPVAWQLTRFAATAPRTLVASPAMRRHLEHAVQRDAIDIVHNHGLWLLPNLYAGLAAGLGDTRRVPLVISPRGALSAWALRRHPWRKRAAWLAWQSRVLRAAACFHATADAEAEDIRRLGFRQPICVIPNGIDIPPAAACERQERLQSPRTVLFLGRIHPTKGIPMLLEAWQRVMARHMGWQLRIAGNDNDGHLDEVRRLASALGVERVTFTGPCHGHEKAAAFRDAALFVLPSHSENFGLTVAEALASGTPAIVTRGAPWSRLDERCAGWWIDVGVAPLASALDAAMGTPPDTLARMGAAGRAWMTREFGWPAIGRDIAAVYEWLRTGGTRPSTVHTD